MIFGQRQSMVLEIVEQKRNDGFGVCKRNGAPN